MTGQGQTVQVDRHHVEITRPTKVLFPGDGITKADLIDYYRRIAPWILPYMRGRPLAMERYPDGIDKPSFFHKMVPSYYPDWIKTVTVNKAGGTVTHVICDNEATLVYLANQACITPHVWLSRFNKLRYPDQMVFDLDPSGEEFGLVKSTAQDLSGLLDELGLPAYVKTTGSKGLHVAVPLKRQEDFDSVRAFARRVAEIVVHEDPGQRTLEQRRNRRRGRVFVDTNRNAYAQTVAPAYAVRARPHAPISVPLAWSELENEDLRPDGVTIMGVFERLEKVGDPWKNFRRDATSLKVAYRKLEKRSATRKIR
ncbi:MAG: ATP-dependent DNA ligase [Acidobacteria bacterium]|nr:MAG: ATP-dependent DNA ligase [Acidobacteriota bacterium]